MAYDGSAAGAEPVVCIGAGPAGLTAAYLLAKAGRRPIVLEADPRYVGGISRTETYKGFAFDIGGHRFFSKSDEVEALWDELLGEDFLRRPRKSRIYYRNRLFDYPLRAGDALAKLGPLEAARCVASYLAVALNPPRQIRSFEDWVVSRFGRRLFEIFFKTYTEKVWGMPCSEISADWAAQRIKGLNLFQAVWRSVLPQKAGTPRGQVIKTLINEFRYPRRGPGMLWEAAAAKVAALGGEVRLGHAVTALEHDAASGLWTVEAADSAGGRTHIEAGDVISTMPMRDLVRAIRPALPEEARRSAEALRYRDFLVVALILKDRDRFDDNWIYIHDPAVKVGRIQNFKSWSPEMVPDPALNCYGLEYFCFEGDGLWTSEDAELVRRASRDLVQLGLADAGDILDGTVIRQPKAYPVYDADYERHVGVIRGAIAAQCPRLHLVGRNGMHKYNNQDHAMMTAMLTVRNILAGQPLFDVWRVNQDAEYHEEDRPPAGQGGRMVPAKL